jgi:hypothetical protein
LIGRAETLQVVGAEIQAFGGLGVQALGADGGLGGVQLVDLVLQPLAELGRHRLQGLFGLGDGVGVDAAETAADLQAQGVGRANDLGRVAHGTPRDVQPRCR